MSPHTPRDRGDRAKHKPAPTAAPAARAGTPPPSDGPPRGRIRHALGAGTEIVISVLVALVFFAVFMASMWGLMPSGLTLGEVVQPEGGTIAAGMRNFTASLEGLGALGERLNPAAAVLTVLNTTVMRKAAGTISWDAVPTGTPLREGDAVQTTRDGTAMLTFSRGRRLQLERNSLMIVRSGRETSEPLNPVPSVRIQVGELWGNVARGDSSGESAVDVTAPGAEAHVASVDTGAAQFRIQVRKDNTSILSVYRGAAEVKSNGQTVHVTANQYVAVDSARGVAPPAPLPAEPELVSPAGDAAFSYRELPPQVEFRWRPVAGVDGYRLRVSSNPDFQGVVLDQRVIGTAFVFGNFTSGPFYWRVSALLNGAEGPPSTPRTVIVTNVRQGPPLKVVFPAGAVAADRCTVTGTSEHGVRIVVAGEPATVGEAGRFQHEVPLKRGFNVVVVEAIDRVGNTTYKSRVVEAKF